MVNPYPALALCLCLALSAAGCGQRGPLYLPEQDVAPQDTGAQQSPDDTEEESDEEDS